MGSKRLFNLEKVRKSKGLTRVELAAKSGIHTKTIEALERGITNVDDVKLSTLIKLAIILKVKVRKIVNEEDKKYL